MFNFIRNRKIQTCLRFIVDFLKDNTIHCTAYLTKTSIHWSELIFWIVSLLALITFAFFNGMTLVKDYKSRNSAITLNTEYMGFETMYPALTLCPHNILNETKLKHYLRTKINKSNISQIYIHDFLQNLSRINTKNMFEIGPVNSIPADNYMQLIFNLSNNYKVRTNNYEGVKIMSEVGICYTLNNFLSPVLYTKHWRDLNPYPKKWPTNVTLKLPTFNFSRGFPTTTYLTHNIIGNITVYTHSPFEIPTIWTRSELIINEDKTYKKITAIVKEINFKKMFLKELSPEERHCLGRNESNLELFPQTYSRNLCLMECRIKYIRGVCNCIPHFYGHINLSHIQICDGNGLNCFNKYIELFRSINANSRSPIFKCSHCQPNCIEQIVLVKITNGKNKRPSTWKIKLIIEHPPLESYQRSVMYTGLDFIVSISGVLSSFFGFCIYSLCDLIYFFTVRIYWFRRGFRGSVDEIVL
ncbi:pickpocket protein 28-like [Cochliomyia hominivorax]